jgi:VWFA-related protein
MRGFVPAIIVGTVVLAPTIIDTILPGAVVGGRWGSAAAQQPRPSPVFRATTDLVEVDVVVHGRNGAFVSDLSIDDFAIEDAGQPQPIQQFYLHVSDAASLPPAAASRQLSEPPPTANSARTFVVVFDDAHLTPAGFKRTQSAAQTLFSKEFKIGDLGGVVVAGRMVNGRLTTDRDELLKAVKDVKPNANKSSRLLVEREWPRLSEIEAVRITFDSDRDVLDTALRRACADDPSYCRVGDPELAVRSKASALAESANAETAQTLRALGAVGNGLAKLPGRKIVLLMTEGFIAEQSWPMVQEVVALAARANFRFYTLDARGPDRALTSVSVDASRPDDAEARLLEQADSGADSINSLAVDTGGFVVRNTNQFDNAIARIGDDVNNYYVLGYRPAAPGDGTYHRLKVSVKRPGLAVRARRGYVATPRAPEPVTTTPEGVPPTAASGKVAIESLLPSEPAPAPPEPIAASAADRPTTAAPMESSTGGRTRPGAEANVLRLAPPVVSDIDATEGWSAYQRGDVESARTRLALAAARPDAEIWVHYTLGFASFALSRYRESAEAWERVRDGAGDFEPVYFDLIDAYLQLKDYDRAVHTARTALERWPQDAEMFQALGVVQTVRGSLDDAVKSFQSAVAIAPDDANVYFNLGKVLELRYYRSRHYVTQLRKWVSNDKDLTAAIANYQRHLQLGGAYADSARAGLRRLTWVPTEPK